MYDIDKDIERVKELQSMIYEGGEYIYLNKNDKQALGNVLKELETRTVQVSGQVQELETWKKIAEKLADEFGYTDNNVCSSYHEIGKCKFEKEKDNRKTCIQCIIYWARKEVENDKQS